MSWWNAKYKNDFGEYEIAFGSKDYEKAKAVEKLCQAIIDKKVTSPEDLLPVLRGWISVEERLPDKNGQYLVQTKWTYGSFIRLCCWTPKYNGFEEHLKGRAIWYVYDSEYGDYECKDITHWMPLPEPPKEEV